MLWDTASYQIWTYDSLNRIISTETFIQNSGTIVKQFKVDINFVNDLIDTKIHYNSDSTNSWINFRKYQFYYTNGLRTSADVYDADSVGNWIILGNYQYFLNDSNQYVIRLQNIDPLSTHQQLSDTLFLDLDTLENVIHSFGWHFINPGQAYYVIDYYLLSDSTVIPSYTSDVLCENWPIDTLWDPIERANQDWYTYDSNNHVLIHTGLGSCTNPCGSDISYSYDSFGRIIHAENYFWTMVYDHVIVDDYVYLDSSELKIIVPPIEDSLVICTDSSFQPNILIAGGCAPYHIQWQPSTGLSSDTAIQPSITVTNPITYTIYADDDYGHYDTAYYTISPFIINNQISVVNQYCDGNMQLSLHPVYGTYQWYFDSTSVATNTTGLFNTSQFGNYWRS